MVTVMPSAVMRRMLSPVPPAVPAGMTWLTVKEARLMRHALESDSDFGGSTITVNLA